MRRLSEPAAVRAEALRAGREGRRVGLVPTMGALHEGHLSLVRRCRAECDLTVVSLFVNPAQFSPGEDLAAYPRQPERDAELLEREEVDILFAPGAAALYAPGYATWIDVEGLSEGLCGAFRPGHFRAVATIVAKLFNVVRPDAAYFGQKDWQQARVIARMAHDLDFATEIVIGPTVRERDGLAMSSRNAYLGGADRAWAPRLYRALLAAADEARLPGRSPEDVRRRVEEDLEGTPLRLQYVEVRVASSLALPPTLAGELVIAAAALLGRTRLIDNVLITIPEPSRGT